MALGAARRVVKVAVQVVRLVMNRRFKVAAVARDGEVKKGRWRISERSVHFLVVEGKE